MKTSISLLFAFIFLQSCTPANVWTRTPLESRLQPGVLVAGVSKADMQFFLNDRGLNGRILSGEAQVYEIQKIDIENFKNEFPDAIVLEDRHIEKTEAEKLNDVVIEISKEEAQKQAGFQLQWLGLEEAHKISIGVGVVVAVIDSGLDTDRFDLVPSLWVNAKEIAGNKIDDDKNGYIDDVNGWNFFSHNNKLLDGSPHGTASAGVIASSLTGIAPQARIMGIRVSDDTGAATYAAMIEGFIYAINQKADLINISMGGREIVPELTRFLEVINKSKVFVSNSAGNSGDGCSDNPYTEAISRFANVMTVGALNLPPANVNLARYSVRGECVKIAAPSGEGGVDPEVYQRGIVTSYPGSQTKYFLYHGTSAAAPVITGVAALVKAKYPTLTGEQMVEHLRKNATVHSPLKNVIQNGLIVNAAKAVSQKPEGL